MLINHKGVKMRKLFATICFLAVASMQLTALCQDKKIEVFADDGESAKSTVKDEKYTAIEPKPEWSGGVVIQFKDNKPKLAAFPGWTLSQEVLNQAEELQLIKSDSMESDRYTENHLCESGLNYSQQEKTYLFSVPKHMGTGLFTKVVVSVDGCRVGVKFALPHMKNASLYMHASELVWLYPESFYGCRPRENNLQICVKGVCGHAFLFVWNNKNFMSCEGDNCPRQTDD